MKAMIRSSAVVMAVLCGAVLLGQTSAPSSSSTLAKAAGPVTLTGTIKTSEPIVKLVAVDRLWADVLKVSSEEAKDEYVYPGKVDEKGNFSVPRLLPGRTYDLIVWTNGKSGDVRWEGVTMDYTRPVLPDKLVTEEDKTWLKEFIEKTSVGKEGGEKDTSFYDKGRILWMAADHKHATLLVELIRDRQFHSGGNGEVIYRTELWYFENLFGGWAKDKNTERVISRVRGQAGGLRQNWQYVPQLGGITIPLDGKLEPVKLALPEKPDPKRGLVGGLK